MIKKKYLVLPGYIYSKYDGEEHYITASTLIKLYNVNPNECVIHDSSRSSDLFGFREFNYKGLIKLTPRYHGDYFLKKEED